MNTEVLRNTENIAAIAVVVFVLIQAVQALTTTLLIEILSKIYKFVQRTRHGWHWLWGVGTFSIALFLLLINSLLQVGIWAASFVSIGQFSNFPDAFYHSAVNFATLGYGDIVMDKPWRILGGLEAISGILMLGLTTATLSSVFTKLMTLRIRRRNKVNVKGDLN